MSVIDDIDAIKTTYDRGLITRDEAIADILRHPQTDMPEENAAKIVDQEGSYRARAFGALGKVSSSADLLKTPSVWGDA